MDPFSALIASYLEVTTNHMHQHVTDVMGTEVQAVQVEYQQVTIPYTYQLWKVQERSVCARYTSNVAEYSKCTIAAKDLFNNLCQELSKQQSTHWRYKKAKGMYCLAATTYEPTIAKIERAPEKTELEEARIACNLATLEVMGSSDQQLHNKRTKICAHYKSLKAGSTQ